jgi:hypothetical protein
MSADKYRLARQMALYIVLLIFSGLESQTKKSLRKRTVVVFSFLMV